MRPRPARQAHECSFYVLFAFRSSAQRDPVGPGRFAGKPTDQGLRISCSAMARAISASSSALARRRDDPAGTLDIGPEPKLRLKSAKRASGRSSPTSARSDGMPVPEA